MPRRRKARANDLKNSRVMTINVPERYVALFDILCDLGIIKSRSEGMRSMMTDWFTEKMKMVTTIDELIRVGRQRVLEYNKFEERKKAVVAVKNYNLVHEDIIDGFIVREWEREDIEILIPDKKYINSDI